jgi:hypothetical protein
VPPVDPYETYAKGPSSLGAEGTVITPSDNDLDPVPKAIVLLSAGNLTIVPLGNDDADTLTFTAAPCGFVPPFRVRRVTAATATVASIHD